MLAGPVERARGFLGPVSVTCPLDGARLGLPVWAPGTVQQVGRAGAQDTFGSSFLWDLLTHVFA